MSEPKRIPVLFPKTEEEIANARQLDKEGLLGVGTDNWLGELRKAEEELEKDKK